MHTGMVDGKEVSENERQFLVNWKAIRRARRKQQRQVLDYPDPSTTAIPTTKKSIYPPLTMPAFPPRQLPRRIKQHQSSELHKVAVPIHQELTENKDMKYINLPHIVS